MIPPCHIIASPITTRHAFPPPALTTPSLDNKRTSSPHPTPTPQVSDGLLSALAEARDGGRELSGAALAELRDLSRFVNRLF
jgi:hypothetical protein